MAKKQQFIFLLRTTFHITRHFELLLSFIEASGYPMPTLLIAEN
ncbi:hypothetical protein SAMN04487894_12821 [Niabella drilacis]|uniref:Uncharacterized protein n=1 Tax=Niabella drilacis (strain DSM 25811 / CCM 8410 / CCUG 62505 / LMG 26954 / E90) TaxID=1285928 RepID=A0A1G7B8Z0_NIADE|nr:hypothetical protein SAMN04487894_12821 [Niabella drilacis]